MGRLEKLRAVSEIPSILVTDPTNVRYLTGFTGSFGQAIVTETRQVFVTDSRYRIQAGEQCLGWDLRTFQAPIKGLDFLRDTVKDLGVSRLGFESDSVTYDRWDSLKGAFSGVELVPAPGVVGKLRMIKEPSEIEALSRACALTDACWEYLRPKIQANVSEYDLALEIEFYFRRQGAQEAFSCIVVSGERSARPHGTPSDKRLQHGDFVTFDFGAKVDGYCGDITRTVVIGEASARHKEIYDAVNESRAAAIDAMRPGKLGLEVDQLSRDVLAKYGLDGYFGHGLGHSLGLQVHDSPSGMRDIEIAEGMVLTVEPGVYIEGFGGCRIEDDVVLRASGAECLTKSPRELLIL